MSNLSLRLQRFVLVAALFALCFLRSYCAEPGGMPVKTLSLPSPISHTIVYSRVLKGAANSRSNPATYGLFVRALPKGSERLLVRGGSLPGLGRVITSVTIDSTGHRIAFLSDIPEAAFALPDRTTVADHVHAHALWICDIDGRYCHRIPLRLPVFDMQWSPGGSTLALDLASPSGDRLAFLRHGDRRLSKIVSARVGQWTWLSASPARIVYADSPGKTIGLLDADTGMVLRIGSLPDTDAAVLQFAPAPDGKRLLVASDSAVYLATAPDWRLHRVLRDLTNLPDVRLFWSPDSRRLVLFRAHYTNAEPGAAPAPEKFAELQIRSGIDFAQSRSLAGWDLGLSGNGEMPTFLGWLDNRSFLLAGMGGNDDRTRSGRIVRDFTDGAPEVVFCDLSGSIDSLCVSRHL